MANVIDDVWECQVEYECGSERGSVVFHKQVTEVTSPQESDLGNALATELATEAATANAARQGLDCFVVCATAQRVPPAEPTRIFVDYGAQTPSINAASVAAQSAMLFSMYPDAGAEIKSGRNFIPFLDSSLQVAGQINDASKAGLLTDYSTFLFDQIILAAVAELKPVLYRYATDILPAVIVEIAEILLRPVLASQRRRVQHHQNFAS